MINRMTTKLEIERKYLINYPLNTEASCKVYGSESARLKQWYLPKDDFGRSPRVRSKYQITSSGPVNSYYFTRKRSIESGVCEEEECEISYKEFFKYLKQADQKKIPIEKTRYYLPFKGKIFELDIFHGFNEGLVILEIELSFKEEEFEIPDYLNIIKEVTDDKNYSNKYLASKK